jgi:hypothetical protein
LVARGARAAPGDAAAGSTAKLIRTYDKNKYEAEKRDAWASHLAVAIAQASGANVIKLAEKTA